MAASLTSLCSKCHLREAVPEHPAFSNPLRFPLYVSSLCLSQPGMIAYVRLLILSAFPTPMLSSVRAGLFSVRPCGRGCQNDGGAAGIERVGPETAPQGRWILHPARQEWKCVYNDQSQEANCLLYINTKDWRISRPPTLRGTRLL